MERVLRRLSTHFSDQPGTVGLDELAAIGFDSQRSCCTTPGGAILIEYNALLRGIGQDWESSVLVKTISGGKWG